MSTMTPRSRTTPSNPSTMPIPPLENGDRLSRAEFERRYDAMPELKKAELIEGEVYVGSRVPFWHGEANAHVVGWIGNYHAYTPHSLAAVHPSIRLDYDNMPQPDACLIIDPGHGGQARISEDDYIENAPELISEIATSNVSLDLWKKMHVYRRNGVLEYLVWRVQDQTFDWFVLRDGEYARLEPGEDGILRSEVFPGLWLDPAAMLRGDLNAVMAVLQRGLASPEHAAFVARLQAK